jgi:AraC family transcriptional regulator
METLDQIRLPLKSSLQSHFKNLKQIARRGQVVPLVDVESVYSVLTVLEQDIIDMIRRLDCLPGRSLFKRADLFMRLEAANDHIKSYFFNDPSTPFLAEISHISRAHFIRLFSSFYGTSPKQMTLSKKLQEARRLMRETDWSVAEVAGKSGFCNRCAFQRLFKERTGLTPLQYRRQSTELIQQSLANTFAPGHTRPWRQETIAQKVGLWPEH